MRPTTLLLNNSATKLMSLLTLLALCGRHPANPQRRRSRPESTLLQSQTQALEKAKQLEQVLQSAASAQQATIDEQTR